METQFIYIPKKLFLLRIAPTTSPGSSQWLTLEWVPFLPPGDLPDPGIEQASLGSPALAGRFFTTEPPRKPQGLITSPPCFLKPVFAHRQWLHSLPPFLLIH